MRAFIAVAAVVLAAVPLRAQELSCATAATEGCTAFHYHVSIWSPETGGMTEVIGTNSFPTLSNCYDARNAAATSNQKSIEQLRSAAAGTKATPNRYGSCHCDMTRVAGDPNFLDDTKRAAQRATERELRMQLVTALADADLAAESARALVEVRRSNEPAAVVPPVVPPVVPINPPDAGGEKELQPGQIRMGDKVVTMTPSGEMITTTEASTGTTESSSTAASTELDVTFSRETGGGTNGQAATAEPAIPIEEQTFIEGEMARLAALLQQVSELPGTADKDRILGTANRRIVLLMNLGRLIEINEKGALARRAANAKARPARLALVNALFGELVAAPWSATRLEDIVVIVPSSISADPEAIWRDTMRYGHAERQLALFAFLSDNAALSEEQEAWAGKSIEKLLARASG